MFCLFNVADRCFTERTNDGIERRPRGSPRAERRDLKCKVGIRMRRRGCMRPQPSREGKRRRGGGGGGGTAAATTAAAAAEAGGRGWEIPERSDANGNESAANGHSVSKG